MTEVKCPRCKGRMTTENGHIYKCKMCEKQGTPIEIVIKRPKGLLE